MVGLNLSKMILFDFQCLRKFKFFVIVALFVHLIDHEFVGGLEINSMPDDKNIERANNTSFVTILKNKNISLVPNDIEKSYNELDPSDIEYDFSINKTVSSDLHTSDSIRNITYEDLRVHNEPFSHEIGYNEKQHNSTDVNDKIKSIKPSENLFIKNEEIER